MWDLGMLSSVLFRGSMFTEEFGARRGAGECVTQDNVNSLE